jgi:mRNA-decapping enzyme subunit 2
MWTLPRHHGTTHYAADRLFGSLAPMDETLLTFSGLDDLSVRFIVNLPREELESVERICFQVEEAQWFYEDFVRPLDPNLPSLNLRQFSMKIFQHCPLFSGYGADVHSKAFSEFLAYKTRVPVRGAILLNETMDQVILVKGWKKGANWSFPRGKINKDEKDIDCAIREVYEETGFDINAAGLNKGEASSKFIEVTMREQHMKLFVFAGVPMNTYFEPRTRKEISAIQWYKLSELPTLRKIKQQQENAATTVNHNKFYMVAPFVKPLKRIISQLRKERNASQGNYVQDPAILEQSVSALPVPSGENVGNDMSRLMTQLRQSSQASRESNYPEVSEPGEATRNASQQLKSMLNLPPVSEEHTAEQQAAALRENKANAMLSLLRSGSSVNSPVRGPQTPFEQILPPPNRPPPSPQHQPVRTPQMSILPAPPVFEVSPDQPDHYRPHRPLMEQTSAQSIHVSPQEQQAMLPPFLRDPPQPYGQVPGPRPKAAAPYRQTGDPQFAPSHPPPAGAPSVIPHASKLPPPKLTAHSSTLLNLFKSAQPRDAAPAAPDPKQPTTVSRPELSAFSPVVHRPPGGAAFSSTSALATPGSETPNEWLKRSSQQETLLGLFRQAKPSPSLAPPLDPVELSAQGSPTHQRVASDQQFKIDRTPGVGNGPITIVKNSEREHERTSLNSGRISATVSGPLNYPQFEKILQRPVDAESSPEWSRVAPQAAASNPPAQPVKILSRPHKATPPEPVILPSPKPAHSTSRRMHTSRGTSKELPFQPQQILKRPQTDGSGPNSPRSVPLSAIDSSKVPVHPNSSIERGPSSASPIRGSPVLAAPTSAANLGFGPNQEHKATLLSLFGAKPAGTSQVGVIGQGQAGGHAQHGNAPSATITGTLGEPRRGSMVSPLSEKPTSGLSSPLGVNKSRVGSLQEMPALESASVDKAPMTLPLRVDTTAGGEEENEAALRTPVASSGGGLSGVSGEEDKRVGRQGSAGGTAPPPPSRTKSSESVSSTVTSPKDRSFLMDFLDSVVSQQGK